MIVTRCCLSDACRAALIVIKALRCFITTEIVMKGVVAVLVSCLASSLALPWVPGSSLPNTNVANLNALRFPRQPSTSNVHYIWYLASLHPHRRLQPPCRGWRCPPPPPHHDPSCKRVKCPKYKVLKKYRVSSFKPCLRLDDTIAIKHKRLIIIVQSTHWFIVIKIDDPLTYE